MYIHILKTQLKELFTIIKPTKHKASLREDWEQEFDLELEDKNPKSSSNPH